MMPAAICWLIAQTLSAEFDPAISPTLSVKSQSWERPAIVTIGRAAVSTTIRATVVAEATPAGNVNTNLTCIVTTPPVIGGSMEKGERTMRETWAMLFLAAMATGCGDSIGKQVEADSPKSIIGKKTQDIGEFDATKKDQVLSDSSVQYSDPISGPLQAKTAMEEQISKLNIQHTLDLYNAEHGRYPKDYAEFMQEIIKKNGISLPMLPYDREYQYDVKNHQLVVVLKSKPEEKKAE